MNPENSNPNIAKASKQGAKSAGNAAKSIGKALLKLLKAIGKLLISLGPIGIVIIIVLIIILVIVAFNAMPGMMKSKLAGLFNIDISNWFMNGSVSSLNENYDDIIGVANYLESMDYSVIGYGFVTPEIRKKSDVLTVEDLARENPDYTYGVDKENHVYHFYNGGSIVDVKYYNKFGKLVNNSDGDYLSIGEVGAAFGYEYKEGTDGKNHFYDESENIVAFKYSDNFGNVIDNTTGDKDSSETEEVYMDEFGVIRSTTANVESDETHRGQLASFKEYFGTGDGNLEGKLNLDNNVVDNDSYTLDNHLKNYKLIRSYLLSDYRIYTLKNDDENFLKTLGNIWRTAFGGNQDGWSKGLIKLYIAQKGFVPGFPETLWTWSLGDLGNTFTLSKTTLTLKKGFGNNPIEVNISGWAPRYGMSLDFLLSLHLGTGAPDLVNAMLQNFDTEIQVYLDGYKGQVEADYVQPGSSATKGNGDNLGEINAILNNSAYSRLSYKQKCQIALTDSSLHLSSPDSCTNPDGPCSSLSATEEDEDGNITYRACCDNCKDYVDAVKKALESVQDEQFEAFTPYIARVVGSWFRDTYFVVPDTEDEAIKNYYNSDIHKEFKSSDAVGTTVSFVRVDEEYLGDSSQNWSQYEMKEDENGDATGEYQLYFLKSDGTTSGTTMEDFLATGIVDGVQMELNGEPVTGYATKAEAETAGWAFVKKVIDVDISTFLTEEGRSSRIEDMKTETSEHPKYLDDRILWTAYQFGGKEEDEWEKVKKGENGSVDSLYSIIYSDGEGSDNDGVFYKIIKSNSVNQYEDAQRGETNLAVKYLFKYRQYYIYDGGEERAVQIEHDKMRILYGYDYYANDAKYDYPREGSTDTGRYYYGKKVVDEYDIQDAINAGVGVTADNFYTGWEGLINKENGYGLKLNEYYGYASNSGDQWVGKVKDLLRIYGRSALRQSYNWYTINNTLDKDNLAEQWLEWQLDMYYMKKYGGAGFSLSDYYNTSLSEDDLLKLDYDPRDPDLVSNLDITKSSLNAFSILENTGTLDADYAYRDFKELIVELNYFDKEELSSKKQTIFSWVLPEVDETGWPNRPWDKQDAEYGTLIHSKNTYKALGINGQGTQTSTEETTTDEEQEEPTEEPTEETTTRLLTEQERLSLIFCIKYQITDGQEIQLSWDENHDFFPTADDHNELADLLWIKANELGELDRIRSYDGYEIEWFKTWGIERGLAEEEEEEETTTATTTTTSGNGIFAGYENDQFVTSPVTGKIIEVGEHERINVYTGQPETVQFITIQVMDADLNGKIKSDYFNDLAAGASYTAHTGYSAADSLNLFGNEYKDVCTGYTVTIDGLNVDLSVTNEELGDGDATFDGQSLGIDGVMDKLDTWLGGDDDAYKESYKFTHKVGTKDGVYETNKIYGLANSSLRADRIEMEKARIDAPMFLSVGVSGYPTVGYKADPDSVDGYYVKEGKYIGKTIASTEEVEAIELPEKLTYTPEDFPEGFPAEYMRIQLRDTDLAIIEDVEKYFDIPQKIGGGAGNGTVAAGEGVAALDAITDESISSDRNEETEKRIKAIMSYLISMGFTPEAAAGFCGNIAVECQYWEGDILHRSDRDQAGVCQWTLYKTGSKAGKGRWKNVVDWITSQGYNQNIENTTTSFTGQIRAAIECPTEGASIMQSRGGDMDTFKAMTDCRKAANYWNTYFEGGDPGIRADEAEQALNVWNGGSYSGKKAFRKH